MGRATITGGGPDGLYNIHVDYGSDRIQAKIDALNAHIDQLYGDLAGAEADLAAAENPAAREQLEAELQAAVDAYQEKVDEKCTMENWRSSPMEIDFRDYNAARIAYENNLQVIYDLQQEMSEWGAKRGEAEAKIPVYEELISAQEGYIDEITTLYEQAAACYRKCLRDESILTPECQACKANLHPLLSALIMARQYLDDLNRTLAFFERQLEEAEAEIERLEPEIKAAEDLSSELQEAYQEARTQYNLTMNDNRAILEKCSPSRFLEELKAVNNAIAKIRALDAVMEELRAAVALLKAQIQAAYFERDNLVNALAQGTTMDREAWCVDLTEDGSGEVASLEIPGEPQQIVLAPGTRAPVAADGKLLTRYAMSAAQVAFNVAILPGWQKFKPTYRVGELIDKDDEANLGYVTLDIARSSATGIPRATRDNAPWTRGGDAAGLIVNQGDLGGIPFEYMECNSEAFDIGDRVVVEFRGMDWSDPYIIGFESWPKGCPTWGPRSYGIRTIRVPGGKYIRMDYLGNLTGFLYWGVETWSQILGTEICRDCWRAGSVSFADNYIDLFRASGVVTVAKRANKGGISFSLENPTSAENIRQKEDGSLCVYPDGEKGTIYTCPYYRDGGAQNYTYVASYGLASGTSYPVGSAQADGVIALLDIPRKNSFDRWHEKGQANLASIYASSFDATIYAVYEPPEEYEPVEWPPSSYIPPDP